MLYFLMVLPSVLGIKTSLAWFGRLILELSQFLLLPHQPQNYCSFLKLTTLTTTKSSSLLFVKGKSKFPKQMVKYWTGFERTIFQTLLKPERSGCCWVREIARRCSEVQNSNKSWRLEASNFPEKKYIKKVQEIFYNELHLRFDIICFCCNCLC